MNQTAVAPAEENRGRRPSLRRPYPARLSPIALLGSDYRTTPSSASCGQQVGRWNLERLNEPFRLGGQILVPPGVYRNSGFELANDEEDKREFCIFVPDLARQR